jgi:hypothetical protein
METVNIVHQKIMFMAETGFIDLIREHLNWDVVKTAVKQRFDIDVHENVKYINGSLAVCQGEVTARFDFDLEIKFSLFINRDGEVIKITTPGGRQPIPEEGLSPSVEPYVDAAARAAASAAASDIAEMIRKLNG